MDGSKIEWTDATWNPVRGCSRISAGCDNCYAMGVAHRFSGAGMPYEGLATLRRGKADWTGVARFIPEQLDQPLRWRKPRRIFVNSMSDLFHHSLSNKEIAAVFGVMAAAPRHTFQVLTKRPERALEFFRWLEEEATDEGDGRFCSRAEACRSATLDAKPWRQPNGSMRGHGCDLLGYDTRWPLPNVWLGVSVEDQETADARLPLLLQCPAAVRFVSYEPALGPVNFMPWLQLPRVDELTDDPHAAHLLAQGIRDGYADARRALDWIIVGGESGQHARHFDWKWARRVVQDCATSGVACFVKQLGSRAGVTGKGNDPEEWPEEIRIREFPKAAQ